MYNLILHKQEATFTEPTEPTGTIATGQWKKYELKLKTMLDKEDRYNENKGKMFRLLMVPYSARLQ